MYPKPCRVLPKRERGVKEKIIDSKLTIRIFLQIWWERMFLIVKNINNDHIKGKKIHRRIIEALQLAKSEMTKILIHFTLEQQIVDHSREIANSRKTISILKLE